MSLKRQDVRAFLDAEDHRHLKIICDERGITVAEFVEALLVKEIHRLVSQSLNIADKVRGTSGRVVGTLRRTAEDHGKD